MILKYIWKHLIKKYQKGNAVQIPPRVNNKSAPTIPASTLSKMHKVELSLT